MWAIVGAGVWLLVVVAAVAFGRAAARGDRLAANAWHELARRRQAQAHFMRWELELEKQ